MPQVLKSEHIFSWLNYIKDKSTEDPKSFVSFFFLSRKKIGFVTATKLGTTNKIFVAATINFAAATKRFVDRIKHFVYKTNHFAVVTKYLCYPYFNK